MQRTKIVGVVLAVLVLTGSAAALPGAAPAQADDYAQNETAGDADVDRAANASAAAGGPPADRGPDGERGPPVDLPAQVPDFVSDIHDLVGDHLAGDLGESIADLTPEDDADESTGNSTATDSDEPDPETATPESDA